MQRSVSLKSTSRQVTQRTKPVNRIWSRKEVTEADTALDRETSTSPPGDNEPQANMSTVFRLTPPKGEKRYVFLDPHEKQFGFILETYFRPTDECKTLRTFVKSVTPQSASFMAGLVAGDTIVEIDGVDVRTTSAEEVVKMIHDRKGQGSKIKLAVEFVDGVTRLNMMKMGDALKRDLRQKQQRLKELVERGGGYHTPSSPLPDQQPLASTTRACASTPIDATQCDVSVSHEGWEVWEEWEAAAHLRNDSNPVVQYPREINTLSCDVIVMPSSSCWNSVITAKQNNAMYQYLKRGGSGLWDELSLLKQGRLGDVMPTGGHGLPVQRIYHCLVGYSEDSAQLCVGEALRLARNEGHLTVALWVDGFAYAQVQPKVLVESVRHWLAEDGNASCFHRVIFSCSTFFSDTEAQVEYYFPHQWLDTQGDSDQSDSIFDDDSCSPKVTQDIPITTDNPLVTLATDQMKEQVQVQRQFEIMPGALQSDV